jgi:hypothetical protein
MNHDHRAQRNYVQETLNRPDTEYREWERSDGYPDGAIDSVLETWQSTLPPGFTATDALHQADGSVVHHTRNLARLAVKETLRALKAAGYTVPEIDW